MALPIHVGMILEPQAAHWTIYMDILSKLEEVSSVSVADATQGTFEPARQLLGSKLKEVYTDPVQMLERERPQMALISMEAVNAPPQVEAAIEHDCHVLLEKPACVRAEDFEALVKKARTKGCHLMLAFAMRCYPIVQDARQLVREGHFGKVYGVQAHFIADQERIRKKESRESWFFQKRQAGGGHLIWLGIHYVDLLQFVTGARIEQVTGFCANVGGQPIDVEDSAMVVFRFDNGMLGSLSSAYYLDRDKQRFFMLWGENGWLRIAPYEADRLEWYSSSIEDSFAPKRTIIYERGKQDTYFGFVRAAVRASCGLQPPPISPEEGLHVLKVIFAAYKAAETGQAQTVR